MSNENIKESELTVSTYTKTVSKIHLAESIPYNKSKYKQLTL